MAGAPANGSEIRQRLSDGGPRHQETSLIRNRNSLQAILMQQAWKDAGESLDNPGTIDQWYFPDEEIVVFDLSTVEG